MNLKKNITTGLTAIILSILIGELIIKLQLRYPHGIKYIKHRLLFLKECKICREDVFYTLIYKNDCCDMKVCKTCIISYIKTKISRFKIGCINYKCDNYNYYEEKFIRSLSKKFNEIRQNMDIELGLLNMKKRCDCGGNKKPILSNEKKYQKYLQCDACSTIYCVFCDSIIKYDIYNNVSTSPNGLNGNDIKKHICKEENSKKLLNDYNNSKYVKYCPECFNSVQKIEGCSYVNCKCGVEFCFNCLMTYPNNLFGRQCLCMSLKT